MMVEPSSRPSGLRRVVRRRDSNAVEQQALTLNLTLLH